MQDIQASSILEQPLLDRLVSEPDDIETMDKKLAAGGYDDNERAILTNYVSTTRGGSTTSSVLSKDILNRLATEGGNAQEIGSELAGRNYNRQEIESILSNVESIRSGASNQAEQPAEQPAEQDPTQYDTDYGSDEAPNIMMGRIQESQDTATSQAEQRKEVAEIGAMTDLGQNITEIKQAFSRPSEIAASVQNIHARNSDLLTMAASTWSAEAKEQLKQDHASLNTLIVNALKANDINVTAIADVDPIETAEGQTQYGDIVYTDKEDIKHKITQSMLQDIAKSKFELVGAIGGGMVGGAGAASVTKNPALIFLGALGGGAVGAGTFAGIDAVYNAWDTKQELDGNVLRSKMIDAGVGDAIIGVAGAGIGAGIGKGVKAVANSRNLTSNIYRKATAWMQSPKNAVSAIVDATGHSKDTMRKTVDKYNKATGSDLDYSNKSIVQAYMQMEPRVFHATEAAMAKAESSGLEFKKMLNKEASELRELTKEGRVKGISQEVTNRLDNYGKQTSKFYQSIEDVGVDIVNDTISKGAPEYKLSFAGNIDTLMNRLKQTSNLDNENLVKILDSKIEDIKRLGSYKTSELAKKEGAESIADKKAIVKAQKLAKSERATKATKEKARRAEAFTKEADVFKKNIDNNEREVITKEMEYRNAIDEDRAVLRDEIRTLKDAIVSDKQELKTLKNQRNVDLSTEALQSVQSKEINTRLTAKLQEEAEENVMDVTEAVNKTFQTSDGGFSDLLALRKSLSALGRDTKLVGNKSVQTAIKTMEKRVANEIDTTAKAYMGESADEWLKNYTQARREWASYSRLKDNDIYKTMMNTDKAGYGALIDKGFASMKVAARKYSEVADRLTPAQRKGFEKAMINKTTESNIVADTVDWTNLSKDLDNMTLRTEDGQALRAVTKRMSDTFGDRTQFGKALESMKTTSSSTGIGTSIYAKAAQQLVNQSFKSMRAKIGITKTNKALALVDTIADIMENPFKAKSVHKLIKETKDTIPEKEIWSTVRQLQDGHRAFGSLKQYGGNTQVYASTTDGKIPTENGVRVVSPTEDVGKGTTKAFNVSGESIKSLVEANDILRDTLVRGLKKSDLKDPKVLKVLEENSVNGVEIGNKVYMLEHWQP